MEVITSFYKHPLAKVVSSVVGSVLAYALLSLSPAGGAIYTSCAALGEHPSMRMPRSVGLVFQRPEMPHIHLEYGRHRNNYGDIVWWDMHFGTYENSATWDGRRSFDDRREQRLGSMLRFRGVHGDEMRENHAG